MAVSTKFLDLLKRFSNNNHKTVMVANGYLKATTSCKSVARSSNVSGFELSDFFAKEFHAVQ